MVSGCHGEYGLFHFYFFVYYFSTVFGFQAENLFRANNFILYLFIVTSALHLCRISSQRVFRLYTKGLQKLDETIHWVLKFMIGLERVRKRYTHTLS